MNMETMQQAALSRRLAQKPLRLPRTLKKSQSLPESLASIEVPRLSPLKVQRRISGRFS
jgi:hypothetical protein